MHRLLPAILAATSLLTLARLRLARARRLARLLAACERGFGPELAQALRIDPRLFSSEDADHWSPLIMACKGGHTLLVAWLLALPVTNIDPRVEETHSALRAASLGGHVEVCRLLLAHGARVNVMSAGKRTPLMGAAMNGHLQVCELLVAHRADAFLVNSTGETALALAKTPAIKDLLEAYRHAPAWRG